MAYPPIVSSETGSPRAASPMVDVYSAPASSQKAVTPNDSTDLPGGVCKALEVLTDGNIVTIAESDSTSITRTAYKAGTIIPVRIRRVLATGTSATVLALY